LVKVAERAASGNPMGEASGRLIQEYSLDRAASGIMAAIHTTAGRTAA
jgi:hypothetical protein